MESQAWIEKEAARTLERLAPRYEAALGKSKDAAVFKARLHPSSDVGDLQQGGQVCRGRRPGRIRP